jgi:hypothetical protein
MAKRSNRIYRETIKRFGIIGLSVLCFWFPLGSIGAVSEQKGVESSDGLIKFIYTDSKHVLTAPLHWKQRDLILFTTISISTFELMLIDKDIQKTVQRNRTTYTDRISKWTSHYTNRSINLTIGGFYLCGLVFNDRKCKETALLCLESLVLSQGITISLKHIVGRTRPFGDKGAFHFDPVKFPPPSYSQSFPSGHATTAFAVSSVRAEQYKSWMVKSLAYGSATLIAWGRVNNNVHFVSDVFYGGMIGTIIGRCLVKFHKKDCPQTNFEFISMSGKHDLKMGVLIWVN